MKKSIFITGICGFIASNVANKLVKLGYDVVGVDNLKFGFKENLDSDVRWHQLGIGKESYIYHGILNNCDVLVHMACANIIYGMDHPIETFKTNALDSINLIEQFAGQIVYTSTSSVYGNAAQIPTSEDSEFNVSNAYDQSKLIFERYLKLRGNYTTLRLSNVYGKNQRPENPYCGVIGKFIDSAIKGNPMQIYGDGLSTRDFTYIDDVVNAIIMAIDQDPKNTEINIGTGIETTSNELSNIISEIIKTPNLVTHVGTRSIDRITRRCLNITKAEEILGWEPKISLSEGIENTIFTMK
jgi:UDP-glucose 4-epimerase